jgi:glycine/D-amino acid oxidase-like deaminating enzyme
MNTDVCIIGGAAMGSALALFLKRLDPTMRVVVLEPDPSYAQASSARSASSIRQQFTTALNIQMSQFGLELIAHPQQWLTVAGRPAPDVQFHESGYLFLAQPRTADALASAVALQRAHGAHLSLFDAEQLAARHPWIHASDIALASQGESGEGWFDGYSYTQALRAKAIDLGAQYAKAAVRGLKMNKGVIQTALLDTAVDGHDQIDAKVFVNAAGPWAARVAAMVGIELPVRARRRTVFTLRCATAIGPTPLVVDPSGIWFRSEGRTGDLFIAGWSPSGTDSDPDDLPLDPNLSEFEERLWPALAHRVPAFEALRVQSAWAGYYEVCTLDHNALLGPHPACRNLLFMNGFSGHGLQHCAAAGRGLAEWIVHGGYRTLDLSPLSVERIVSGTPYVEANVI